MSSADRRSVPRRRPCAALRSAPCRRLRAVLCTLAAVPLLAGCPDPRPERVETPADAAEGEIIFGFTGPNDAALIVPVYINGQGPYEFVLDTGATLTCVSQRVADLLELSGAPGAVGYGAGVGGAGRFELLQIDSLRIGETRAYGLLGCALDLQHFRALGTEIDGLLGLNFLREFLVTLDFERNVLRLEQP